MASLDPQTEQGIVIPQTKSKRKLWLWGCGGSMLLFCLLVGGVLGYVMYQSSRPFQLDGKITLPPTIQQGDDFDFVITLTNSTTEPVFIKHIVFFRVLDAPFLLEGATVSSIEPNMESEPLNARDVQYAYFREIMPGETQAVIFHMQAEKSGLYYENIGVYAKDPSRPEPAFLQAFHLTGVEIEISP
ncbi:MAG TPA: hypothetical protein VN843_08075 [Anaerolineales bacterium]|nr:hypothetical protein [Anaerolineales bacterium]